MALATPFKYTTGETSLPDVGELSYNGCVFSPLYETKLSGKVVRDNANRTTKYMEYTLVADGYVTLRAGNADIAPSIFTMRKLLTAHGGQLTYVGRGFELRVNGQGNQIGANLGKGGIVSPDVAWGPAPELIEFQPLGGGLSAKVQWKVTVRIPELPGKPPELLQLNYETTVSYGEDQFSSVSMRGTLEIPMTRTPNQASRKVTRTADDFRGVLEKRILGGIDLSRFRIVRREFTVSRDKRTLEWDVGIEERPYMGLPEGCTIARGSYSVRPTKVGLGLIEWLCTLKATYTVRNDLRRRTAWLRFLSLMRLRMRQSSSDYIPSIEDDDPGFGQGVLNTLTLGLLGRKEKPVVEKKNRAVWLIDFSVEEGLYLDSKTTTFSATWRLLSKFSFILLASGVWTKVPEEDQKGNNLWAASMRDIGGTQSWLTNRLDPTLDVIVDFGTEY